jgi:hypothetical protein
MIWLVWRQHRLQALFALLGLAALAAFLAPTGIRMHHAFERSGLDGCLRAAARVEYVQVGANPDRPADAASAQVAACEELAGQFSSRYGGLGLLGSCCGSCRCSSACSGVRRWWPGRSSRAPTGWCGPRG